MNKVIFLCLFLASNYILGNDSSALYLDLMKKVLINSIYRDPGCKEGEGQYKDEIRENGFDWPSIAHTMVGLKRLNNIQFCVEDVLKNNVPGDFIETGVWRGGSTIFMCAILKAWGNTEKLVWVADSFEGLPAPNEVLYPADAGIKLHTYSQLAVSLESVKSNFERYGLLNGQVRFLKGWFSQTLPKAPIGKLAIMRLDGDLYESTMDALVNLYSKLSIGGYIIIDDYGMESCRRAVNDFREKNGIIEVIQKIDHTGAFWKRLK